MMIAMSVLFIVAAIAIPNFVLSPDGGSFGHSNWIDSPVGFPNRFVVNLVPLLLILGILLFACMLLMRRRTRSLTQDKANDPKNCDEPETRLTQELYRISQRMEALETILLDRANTPHHPVRTESAES